MSYTEKDWKDSPLTTTPLSAAAMEDLEMRTTDYVATYAQGVNVWESEANPASVTDWGPVINALLTAGYRYLYFNENDFPFTTQIALSSYIDYHGVVLMGAGGRSWMSAGTVPTRLIYKGSGSTSAWNLGTYPTGGTGIHLENLGLFYDNAAFTGDLLDTPGSMNMVNCNVGYIGTDYETVPGPARCLLSLYKVNGTYVRNSQFWGAQSLIRGFETTDVGDFSNQHSFRDVVVSCWEDHAFVNIGLDWLLDGVCFEFFGCGSTAVGIGSDVAHVNSSVFALTGRSSFWDSDSATQVSIQQPVGVSWNMQVRDTWFHNNVHSVSDVDLQGIGGVVIENCQFGGAATIPSIDLGDVGLNGNNSRKERVTIRNCVGFASGTPGGFITNLEGHGQVLIEQIGEGGGNFQYGPQFRTLGGYERITYGNQEQVPTGSWHSGYTTSATLELHGVDGYGILLFDTANGQLPAGLAVDITFEVPLLPAYRFQSPGPKPYLAVELTPMGVTTTHPDGDAMAAADPYAIVPNASGGYTDSYTTTLFSIGFTNAIAQSKKCGLMYRVIQL